MKPARAICLHIEALEDRLMPSTLASGITAPITTVIYQPDWFQTNLSDPGLQSLARADYSRDYMITRNDMLGLFAQTESDGVVSSAEFHDLGTLVAAGRSDILSMPDWVQNLAAKVVNGDPDNAHYQYVQPPLQNYFVAGSTSIAPGTFHSIPLGNLVAGSPAGQLQDLVNKWFLGMDVPSAYRYVNGTYTLRNWGYDSSAPLFHNGMSFADIRQGATADGQFLASVAALVNQSPVVLASNIIDNGDGTFTVRFFNTQGTTSDVTVNRWLPEDASGKFVYANKGQSLGDASVNLWVPLYEKAFIEANASGKWGMGFAGNGYGMTIGVGTTPANLVAHLTGSGFVDSTFGNDSPLGNQAGFSQFVDNRLTNQVIVSLNAKNLGTFGSVVTIDGFTIVSGQTYALLDHDPVSGLFTVFNPWGLGNGRACDVLHLTWQQMTDIFASFDTGLYPWYPPWLSVSAVA